jgi:hypothetical protein
LASSEDFREQMKTRDHEQTTDPESSIVTEPQRVDVYVSITVGDEAVLVTPQHPANAPLRMPAATIARSAGLPENELPGRRFTAMQAGDELRDFRLVDDPRI